MRNIIKEHTCAFTGLRPHKLPFEEGSSGFAKLMENLEHMVQESIGKGYRVFLSGGAMGADLWFAEIALRFREDNPSIQLHCILPFEGQTNGWPEEWQRKFRSVYERSNHVEYTSPHYTKQCYFVRNRVMVDRASLVLALYDGSTQGGTAYTVSYAKSKEVNVVVLDPR